MLNPRAATAAATSLFFILGCGGGNPTTPPSPGPTATPTPAATAPPNPLATPAACPRANRWGVGLHTCTDLASGDNCVADSTPRFGESDAPCNDEHHEVCGGDLWRHCEDPRGPIWSVAGAPECTPESDAAGVFCWKVHEDNPFQLRLKSVRGKVNLTANWRPDASDEEGKPLDLSRAVAGQAVVKPVR